MIWCAWSCLVFLSTGVRQQRKGNVGYSCVHKHTGSYPPCSFIVGPGLTFFLVWSGLEQKCYFYDFFCRQSCPSILFLTATLGKLRQGFLALQLLILANLPPPPAEFRVYPDLLCLWHQHCRESSLGLCHAFIPTLGCLATVPQCSQQQTILFRRQGLPPPTPSLVLSRFSPQISFCQLGSGLTSPSSHSFPH